MSTLIEKLEREHDDRELTCQDLFEDGHFDDEKTELLIQQTGVMAGLQIAIDIVKRHSDWISVDERLPEPNKIVLVAIHYPQYYVPDFMYVTTADYDEVRKKWSSITNVAELKNVVYWQPFPKLPNPPSEVHP